MTKIKKIGLSVFIVLSLASISYIYYLSKSPQSTPPTQPESSLPPVNLPHLNTPTLSFEFPSPFDLSVPTSLKVYSSSAKSISNDQALQIASSFGFSSSPKTYSLPTSETVLIWTEGSRVLSVKLSEALVTYSNPSSYPGSKFTFAQDQLFQKASSLIEPINKFSPYRLTPLKIIYKLFLTDENVLPGSSENSNIAEIQLSPALDNLQIIDFSSPNLYSSVSIDTTGQITSAEIFLPNNVTNPENRPTISIEGLKSSVSQAKLINYTNPATLDAASDVFLGKVKITSASLAYLKYPNQSIFLPVFVLEATGKSRSGADVSGVFALPAVK